MSGVDAIVVLGVISSIVSIIDGIKQVYDAITNAQGLPRSLRAAAGRLPIITNILNSAKQRIVDGEIDEDACKGVKLIVDACEEKAKELDEVFKKAVPTNDATDLERYYKAVKTYGKKNEVENLIKEIMEDVFLLNSEHGRNTATKTQVEHLAQDIADLRKPGEVDATACMSALLLTDPRDDRGSLVRMKGSRVDGTIEWIKTNALYLSWLSSDSQLLWLSGGPGKGKTMISIFIAEELEQVAKRSPNTVFLQYFCDNRDEKRDKAISILRGLVYQLLVFQPELFEHILPSFKTQKESLFTSSSFESLWRIFETMLRDPILSTIYCVLDGLDECDKASLDALLKKLKGLFSTNSREASPFHLNLIILSRDFPDIISEMLFGFPRIRLDPDADTEVNNDIRHFIDVKVNELSAHQEYSESLREHVKKVFYNRAEGTFLWVGIVAESLRNLKESDVVEVLDLFPPGLEPLYDRMLLQIENDRREIVSKILRWVVMAVRPLTLSELSAAIGISPIVKSSVELSCEKVMRDKISYCRYFLTVEGEEVRLIHQSAKDYLLRQRHDSNDILEAFRVKEAATHLEIVKKCLDYLQSGALADGEVNLRSDGAQLKAFPLLSYAAVYWPEHARSQSSSELFDLSLPFYRRKSQVRMSWVKTYMTHARESLDPFRPFTLLDLASYFGFMPLAENLLHKGVVDKVERLLGMKKRKERKSVALLWAVQGGNAAIAQLLLKNGAEIEGGKRPRKTALGLAAKRGDEAMVRLLLQNGADVNSRTRAGDTALICAAEAGFTAVAKLLLEKGADVDAKNKFGHIALPSAAGFGNEELVRLLLDHGANIDSKEQFGDTALTEAARGGFENIVQLLLEKGADVEVKDSFGRTALGWAITYGNDEAVRLLLEHGADIEKKNSSGDTALIQAAHSGHMSHTGAIIDLLLGKGANIEAKDENGKTALSWAAQNDGGFMVKRLLDEGADIEAKDQDGKTALFWAAQSGHVSIVELLVEKGARVEAGDDGLIVRQVLEKGAKERAEREKLRKTRVRRPRPIQPKLQPSGVLSVSNSEPA